MADEVLRLNAAVIDNFTKPLQNLKSQLAGVSQAPALAGMRKDWGNVTKEISGGARALQTAFLPALSGINVASLGAAGSITSMVAAMKGMSEGAVQAGVFRRSVDITGEKFKEMKLLGELFGQSSEQTMRGLQGLHSTIDQLKNRYGPAFQKLAELDLGTKALALKGANTMSEALDMAMAIIRAEPNKKRQEDIAIALGYPGLEIIARETNEKILAEVRRMGQNVSGLSEQAAIEFNLNMMRLKDSSENLTKRALAPLVKPLNDILTAVAPIAESVFTQLAIDIKKTFTGLSGIGELWKNGDYFGMFKMIGDATDMGIGKKPGRDKQIDALEKRLDILKDRRGQPGSEEDVFEEKTIKKQLEELRGHRDLSKSEWDDTKKRIADIDQRLEEIKELRTGPVAMSLQSDLEKEEAKLREEIKKLRETLDRGADLQKQGLQGAGSGGLIQPAGGGSGGGGLGAGRYSLGGGTGIGPALGGTDPTLSGRSGIGPALGDTDPTAGGGASSGRYRIGARGPGPTTEAGHRNVNSWMNFMMRPVDQGGLGMTRAQAAGNVASLMGESGPDLGNVGRTWSDPSGRGAPGTSGGVGSWRDPAGQAGRLTALRQFAAARGVDWRTHDIQQQFYRHEMLNTPAGRRAMEAIRASNTPLQALGAQVRYFEAPADVAGGVRQRSRYLARLMGGQDVGYGGDGRRQGGGGGSVAPRGADPRLADIVGAAQKYLPPGYTVRSTSGFRGGTRQSFHGHGKALDVQIFDPQGRPISNRGEDPTGLYQRLARGAYREQLQQYPGMTGKFAWGGAFGTQLGGGGVRDLMHFDFGGERGRYTRYRLSRMGPLGDGASGGGGHMPSGALLRAGAAGEGPPSLEAKGTVNIDLHDNMKDKTAKQNMDGMFRKLNINRGRSMPMPDAPPI